MGKFITYIAIGILGISLISLPQNSEAQRRFFSVMQDMGWATDFEKQVISLTDIQHGGPPKDGIPAIDDPEFLPASEISEIADHEPVLTFEHGGVAKAYPFRVLIWHEIANDTVGGLPVSVTYCPLCNSAYVFDRTIDGVVTTFGTTGWLRNSNLLMYDRDSETWWQQFTGEAMFGRHVGKTLTRLPARIESFGRFAARFPEGQVLVPNDTSERSYGETPYAGYDALEAPWMYRGEMPDNISPMARVVVVNEQAWSMAMIAQMGRYESDQGLVFTWSSGQASAMDSKHISNGRDVGNIIVEQITDEGNTPVVYGVDYAFVFHAFYPDSAIITE